MPRLDYTLNDHILKGKSKLTTDHSLLIISRAIDCLELVHSTGYIHNDLKP